MPTRYRLARSDFDRMRGFIRLQGRLFSLSYGTLPGRTASGAACVVSKKVAARAVDRNRIKRRSRAILETFARSAKPAAVVVAYAKKGAADASFEETRADLESLLARTGRN